MVPLRQSTEPGEKAVIVLRASSQPFQTWGTHPEVGGSGSEYGSSEHGSMEGFKNDNKSGSSEHGSGGS